MVVLNRGTTVKNRKKRYVTHLAKPGAKYRVGAERDFDQVDDAQPHRRERSVNIGAIRLQPIDLEPDRRSVVVVHHLERRCEAKESDDVDE